MIPPSEKPKARLAEKSPTCSASRRPTAAGEYRGTAQIPSYFMLKPCFGHGGVSRTTSTSAQQPVRRQRTRNGNTTSQTKPALGRRGSGSKNQQYSFYKARYHPPQQRAIVKSHTSTSALTKPIPVPDLGCKLYLAKSMTPRLSSARDGQRTPIKYSPTTASESCFPTPSDDDIETRIRQQVESELTAKFEAERQQWMETMQQEVKDQWDMVKMRLDDKDKRISELEAIISSMENRQNSATPSQSGSPSVKEYISTQLTHNKQAELEALDAELADLIDFENCE
eukprot:TRINITY_DN7258_c0_g1_i1.p1 TRINITY_DN7258_c0_g1~~TRINITY_DN7258_c0_g1_i1.p1  ORF type:complete len:303 (+),score=68.22 TRINITY_DN7258_c0_g1_i1:62-910(+)